MKKLALFLLLSASVGAADQPTLDSEWVTLLGTVVRHFASGYFVDVSYDEAKNIQTYNHDNVPKGRSFFVTHRVLVIDQPLNLKVYPAGVVQTADGDYYRAFTDDPAKAVLDPNAPPVKLAP